MFVFWKFCVSCFEIRLTYVVEIPMIVVAFVGIFILIQVNSDLDYPRSYCIMVFCFCISFVGMPDLFIFVL